MNLTSHRVAPYILFTKDLKMPLKRSQNTLKYFYGLLRGNKIREKRFYRSLSLQHPPVLLIHGFLGTRGVMYNMEKRLNSEGFCLFSFAHGTFNIRDIRTSAQDMRTRIAEIIEEIGVSQIDIIGHSMGGLIALYYIKKLGGDAHVRKLISLGTPFQGTPTAWAGIASMGVIARSAWQMRPGSSFLADLHEGDLPKNTLFYTIRGKSDMVCPWERCKLPGALDVTVDCDHAGLVQTEEVFDKLVHILDA